VTLGAFALGLAVGLLLRLTQRSHENRELRDNAMATLRESGEHFFGPLNDVSARQPVLGA